MIDDSANDDNSTVCMTSNKLKELNIFKGDPVLIKGKKRKETLCIALPDNNLTDDKISMNKTVRNNLRCRLGDMVIIKGAPDVPNLTKIHVLPMEDTIEGIAGDLTATFLIPYFRDAYRPLKKYFFTAIYWRHFCFYFLNP